MFLQNNEQLGQLFQQTKWLKRLMNKPTFWEPKYFSAKHFLRFELCLLLCIRHNRSFASIPYLQVFEDAGMQRLDCLS